MEKNDAEQLTTKRILKFDTVQPNILESSDVVTLTHSVQHMRTEDNDGAMRTRSSALMPRHSEQSLLSGNHINSFVSRCRHQ